MRMQHELPLLPNSMSLCFSLQISERGKHMVIASQGIDYEKDKSFSLSLEWHRSAERYRVRLALGSDGTASWADIFATDPLVEAGNQVEVCATSDRETARIYIDGVLEISGNHSRPVSSDGTRDVIIGPYRLSTKAEIVLLHLFYPAVWTTCAFGEGALPQRSSVRF